MNVQAIDTTQRRLRILGEDEIEALYGRPHFTYEERREYFSLSQPEQDFLQELRSVKSQIYCILQLGYFKAKHLFFTFDLSETEEDIDYILAQHFDNRTFDDLSAMNKRTRLKQQHFILALYNYRSCNAKERQQLEAKARQAVMVCGKPIYVFRELLHYLTAYRLIAPGYSFMQDTIGQALTYEQDRLTTVVRQHLHSTERERLNRLLDDTPGRYEITHLKHEPKDFSASEIKREIRRGDQIRDLYRLVEKLLPHLNISNESITYYASLVTYYSVFRLKRFDQGIVHVYLLCFVYHRYQRLHDNLLNCLIYDIRRYTDSAKEAAKDRVYAYRDESNENLQKAGHVLKLFTNDALAPSTPFHDVQARAFAILERQRLDFVAEHMTAPARCDATAFQWEHVDVLAPQFKRHLRPILLAVEWAASAGHAPLMEAVQFLQTAFRNGRTLARSIPA